MVESVTEAINTALVKCIIMKIVRVKIEPGICELFEDLYLAGISFYEGKG